MMRNDVAFIMARSTRLSASSFNHIASHHRPVTPFFEATLVNPAPRLLA
jgi:hypothetical protein